LNAPIVEYKGMHWVPEETVYYPNDLECTMAIDRLWKLLMKGKVTLNFHKNSLKYEPQAVLSVFTRGLPVRQARAFNNDWNRMELPFPINRATYDFFMGCACNVDAKLKGL